MEFYDREDAGRRLSCLLDAYKGQHSLVFALPRGGVVVAKEIAHFLHAPLDILLAHKIGHPNQPEFAIAALSENGSLVENSHALQYVDKEWYTEEKERQMREIQRRRKEYGCGKSESSLKEKTVFLVDDGIATGLTMKAALLDLKQRNPRKLVVAVPVAPESTARVIESMVDEFLALEVPSDSDFRGAIGAYYRNFSQVEDTVVRAILQEMKNRDFKS